MHDYSKLQNIKATTLETGRTYHTPAGDFSSITTILGATADKRWMDRWKQSLVKKLGSEEAAIAEMKSISKYATDRGTKVHEYAERYFNGENILPELTKDNEYYDIQNMTKSLIKETETYVDEIWAQEIAVYSEKLGSAGRLDMVGIWKGKPTIIDFKTSKKKKYESGIGDYKIQCCFYAECHNEIYKTNIKNYAIIIAVQDLGVQVFEGSTIYSKGLLLNRINTYHSM